jgi:hypothetical protein
MSDRETTSMDDEKRKCTNTLFYRQIEHPLLETEADLLVILDCCYAGALAHPRMKRGPSHRIFSFLASTHADQTAVGPGDDSFTSALTHSLRLLVDRADGFTIMELLGEIQRAPYFKDTEQHPMEGWREEKPTDRRLKIRPLSHPQSAEPPPGLVASPEGKCIDETQYLLRLNFAFSEPPNEDHISGFVFDLAHMIKTSQSPVKSVSWGILARRTKRISWKFRNAAWAIVRKRRESSVPQLAITTQSLQGDEYLQPSSFSDYSGGDSTALTETPSTIRPINRTDSQSIHIENTSKDNWSIRLSFGGKGSGTASAPFRLSAVRGSDWPWIALVVVVAFITGGYLSNYKDIWDVLTRG